MARKQKTSAEQIQTAERRQFVLSLRKMGVSYERIAEEAVAKFGLDRLPKGWDARYAYKDVERELDKLYAETKRDAEIVRWLWQERLDRMLMAVWPLAVGDPQNGVQPSLSAIDRVLKIGERQAKLAGADAPTEIKTETPMLVVVDR